MEKKRNILRNAIYDLPLLHTPEDCWDAIESKLAEVKQNKELNKASLTRAINELPKMHADAELFEKIVASLNEKRPFVLPRKKLVMAISGIAASIIALTMLFQPNVILENNKTVVIEHTVSAQDKWGQENYPIKINQAESYISHACESLPTVCNHPEFKEYKTELERLKKEYKAIELKLKMFDNDPQLSKYKLNIQLAMDEITREMLKYLMS